MEYLATGRVHIGDVRELAARLEPRSIQTIVTSPPYFGLRDYGTATWEGGDGSACDHRQTNHDRGEGSATFHGGGGHGQARRTPYRGTCARCGATRVDKQLGMEATPAEFVANLVAVFAALRPALKDSGTIWLNLGDSYAGGGGYAPDAPSNVARREKGDHQDGAFGFRASGQDRQPVGKSPGIRTPGIPNKCLLGIPWRVAFALIDDGWILRSEIIWNKPSPMPESVRDRPTRSHEQIFLLSKKPNYFYDAEAIKEPAAADAHLKRPHGRPIVSDHKVAATGTGIKMNGSFRAATSENVTNRNKRSVWTVTAGNFPGAHFATFPPDLIRPCILSGTSAAGECSACGKAWVRVVERTPTAKDRQTGRGWVAGIAGQDNWASGTPTHSGLSNGVYQAATTTGWAAQCACGAPTRPQTVLDPFMGSGTVAQVAHELGRDWIGLDLDERAIGWTNGRLAKMPVGTLPGLATAAD